MSFVRRSFLARSHPPPSAKGKSAIRWAKEQTIREEGVLFLWRIKRFSHELRPSSPGKRTRSVILLWSSLSRISHFKEGAMTIFVHRWGLVSSQSFSATHWHRQPSRIFPGRLIWDGRRNKWKDPKPTVQLIHDLNFVSKAAERFAIWVVHIQQLQSSLLTTTLRQPNRTVATAA